jgi:transposase InsO family protein
MSAAVEVRLVELRGLHPGWGADRLRYRLLKEGFDPAPSTAAIGRALRRLGLTGNGHRRPGRREYRRWERGQPMELWQLDVMGGVQLADGTEVKAVTGIDDHSRFCVAFGLVERATARPVCAVFAQALRTHGVPEEVLTDIQSWCAAIRADPSAGGEDRCRPAPARHRCLTEWSAKRLLAC